MSIKFVLLGSILLLLSAACTYLNFRPALPMNALKSDTCDSESLSVDNFLNKPVSTAKNTVDAS